MWGEIGMGRMDEFWGRFPNSQLGIRNSKLETAVSNNPYTRIQYLFYHGIARYEIFGVKWQDFQIGTN